MPNVSAQLAQMRIPAKIDELRNVRRLVRATCRKAGCPVKTTNQIVLAIDEACSNVIRHGYGPDFTGDIELEILEEENELVFRLTDSAEPVDPAILERAPPDELRAGGLGIHLIRSVMDRVEYAEAPAGRVNLLLMRKRI